jgi:hypothetical protein
MNPIPAEIVRWDETPAYEPAHCLRALQGLSADDQSPMPARSPLISRPDAPFDQRRNNSRVRPRLTDSRSSCVFQKLHENIIHYGSATVQATTHP